MQPVRRANLLMLFSRKICVYPQNQFQFRQSPPHASQFSYPGVSFLILTKARSRWEPDLKNTSGRGRWFSNSKFSSVSFTIVDMVRFLVESACVKNHSNYFEQSSLFKFVWCLLSPIYLQFQFSSDNMDFLHIFICLKLTNQTTKFDFPGAEVV